MPSLINEVPTSPAAAQAPPAVSLLNGTPDPYDFSDKYNTQLTPAQEAAFQAWGREQAAASGRNPALDNYDYDMRGFWQSNGTFAENGHAGDAFKKPNHPTFSNQSQYHGIDGHEGGTWGGGQNGEPWTFIPGRSNLQMHDAAELQQYFNQVEKGNRLILPASLVPM